MSVYNVQIIKYHMHDFCLFVICIIIIYNDNTMQSNVFHLSYMAVNSIHIKMKVGKVENEMSEGK